DHNIVIGSATGLFTGNHNLVIGNYDHRIVYRADHTTELFMFLIFLFFCSAFFAGHVTIFGKVYRIEENEKRSNCKPCYSF
ncbi:MAG: hypothetical protein IJ181_00470, partial [Acidaminococcaceae bacterium]|nr:hypothetical protein [Acidaminococcaceae bacterium]